MPIIELRGLSDAQKRALQHVPAVAAHQPMLAAKQPHIAGIRIGLVKPNSVIEAAIRATCSAEWSSGVASECDEL